MADLRIDHEMYLCFQFQDLLFVLDLGFDVGTSPCAEFVTLAAPLVLNLSLNIDSITSCSGLWL
jgi:hypothetical protein